ADIAASTGDIDRAARLREEALALEPYDEYRYVTLACLLLDNGRRSAAAGVARRAERAMDELGVPVSGALADVVERLRR
ncbi:MAG TPA: hypothetical protein VEA78_11945, partial [Acidimicrobiales bacterium]|nr:hypothetical protein [Acidimicrobiales bacterium]